MLEFISKNRMELRLFAPSLMVVLSGFLMSVILIFAAPDKSSHTMLSGISNGMIFLAEIVFPLSVLIGGGWFFYCVYKYQKWVDGKLDRFECCEVCDCMTRERYHKRQKRNYLECLSCGNRRYM